ncbi:MAG: winged helix-turn-helix transcriptional regulator [Burkholderiales bacterium]|nr:winged helix-turn-helix transcriptional regulator [Burkholderiales bacterium]
MSNSNVERVFEALASTARRKILAYLSATELTAGEIATRFEMSKPALSKHLRILEDAGLVESDKRGQYVWYRLVPGNLVNTLGTFAASVCPVGGPLKRESQQIKARRSAGPQGPEAQNE